ncbi:MAG: RNA methyltransferase [Planctomycetota bacterium]|nr:RNA methyltransferase [Planctomycetaceae bacterium]MDQ3330368.1 RNA methyltransferase [Planctomycetota bacterium]
MPISLDDPRLEPFRHLKRTNLTRWSGRFIAEGEKVVERLLLSRFRTESVLVDESRIDVLDRLPPAEAVLVLPHADCMRLTGYDFHQGVLAGGVRSSPLALSAVVPLQGPAAVVVAPRMTNPDNLGALLRLAAAFGVDAVMLGKGSADPLSRRALRVSMGAALAVPTVETHDTAAMFAELRNLEMTSIATVLDPSASVLMTAARPERLAILLGNEAHGLAEDEIAACDGSVTIPMAANADSLNVSAAAAIVLYHFLRVAGTR